MAKQGGSREQHSQAGQQSHKNDDRNKDRQGSQQQGEDRNRGQQGGGERGQQSSGERGGSGNFSNDRERASEAGRKGGQS